MSETNNLADAILHQWMADERWTTALGGVPAFWAEIAADISSAALTSMRAEITRLSEANKQLMDDNGFVALELARTADKLAASEAERERLVEAVTPSAETKAAYIGEFSFRLPDYDEDGNEVMRSVNVPWVTIKEIMKAISARAALAAPAKPESKIRSLQYYDNSHWVILHRYPGHAGWTATRQFNPAQDVVRIEEILESRARYAETLRSSAPANPAQPARDDVLEEAVYVASRASIPARSEMWRDFRASGVKITSSWIDEAGEGETEDFGELWSRIYAEIAAAGQLVLYAEQNDFPLKGALVEVGIAIGLSKPVTVCLPGVKLDGRTSRPIGSWIAHPLVIRNDNIDDVMRALKRQDQQRGE